MSDNINDTISNGGQQDDIDFLQVFHQTNFDPQNQVNKNPDRENNLNDNLNDNFNGYINFPSYLSLLDDENDNINSQQSENYYYEYQQYEECEICSKEKISKEKSSEKNSEQNNSSHISFNIHGELFFDNIFLSDIKGPEDAQFKQYKKKVTSDNSNGQNNKPNNEITGEKPKRRGGKRKRDNSNKFCLECNTNETPEWRRGPLGLATLCNACGLRYAKKLKQKNKPYPFGSLGFKKNIEK